MDNWRLCESECLDFLKVNYSNENYRFSSEGGSNSTKSDILLTKNKKPMFYIEAKMKNAQCGQFVAFPKKETRSFEYSKANAYPENIYSSLILEKMSDDFDSYKAPGTNAIEILMEKSYFYSWVYDYYKAKGVKYFVVEKEVGINKMTPNNFIIFPLEHFDKYFDIKAFYRRKKSGSSNPTEKDYNEIKEAAELEGFKINEIYKDKNYVYVQMKAAPAVYKLPGDTYTFQFKNISDNTFKVTKLSNTSNPNVIFSISLVHGQDEDDLKKFQLEFN